MGGRVGAPTRTPVPDDGAVVGHDPAPTFPLGGVVVEVGAACPLEAVALALAAVAVGLAADDVGAAAGAAGAGQGAGHRGLRRRRWRSSRVQSGQRSPNTTRLPQWPMHFGGERRAPVGATKYARLLPTAPEEEGEPGGACAALVTYAHDPGPRERRHSNHGDVVELGAGPGDALAVRAPAVSTR
jgi:hypothetical protein